MPEQNEPLRISEAHRPDLSPGAYKLSLTWAVNVREGDNDGGDEQCTFQIAGDRFSLKPADVHSMYPPEGGSATEAGFPASKTQLTRRPALTFSFIDLDRYQHIHPPVPKRVASATVVPIHSERRQA